jgi:hypothetical protein
MTGEPSSQQPYDYKYISKWRHSLHMMGRSVDAAATVPVDGGSWISPPAIDARHARPRPGARPPSPAHLPTWFIPVTHYLPPSGPIEADVGTELRAIERKTKDEGQGD